jgi:hypothetical protein
MQHHVYLSKTTLHSFSHKKRQAFMKKNILPILLLFVINSCGGNPGKDTQMLHITMPEAEILRSAGIPALPTPAGPELEKLPIKDQKIIKNGSLTIRVTDLEKTRSGLDSLVETSGGYLSNEQFYNHGNELGYHLTIRVPSERFEQLIEEIESGQAEVLYKQLDARDVTLEFIDLETRLENKKAYLGRYRELLAQAGSVKDVLEIQDKMRLIEEEIESQTKQLTYLSNQVSFSTLNLNISKQVSYRFVPGQRAGFFERLKQSLYKGWTGFVDFLLFLIRIWPLWLILATLTPLWKRWRKNRRNSQS